jgi:hypothetical protein
MINAQLSLIIPVFVPALNTYQILSTTDYDIVFPSIDLSVSQKIDETISVLLKRYLQESDGVNPKLIDVTINDILTIYYLCFVNYETKYINGVLKNIDVDTKSFPTNAEKIISLLVK